MSIYEYDEAKTMRMFREEALEDGIQIGTIRTTIKLCLEFNIPSKDILQRLMTQFQLSENEAQEYLDKYSATEVSTSN